MFENKTFESIKQSIIDKLTGTAATIEGSYTGDIIAGAALEIEKLYAYINTLKSAMFPTADSGEYLEMRCADYGITRKPASKAVITVTLSAASAVTLPKGTLLQSQSTGLNFGLTATVSLKAGEKTTAQAECTTAGAVTLPANDLLPAAVIKNLTVTNSKTSAGADAETDSELYRRLQLRLRYAPGCGTAADYRRWALEVPGCGYAKASANAAGKIVVVVTTPTFGSMDHATHQSIIDNINAKRPLGASVQVLTALNVEKTLTATVDLYDGYTIDIVTAAFDDSLKKYCGEIAFDGETDKLTIARITYLLMATPGIKDATAVKINGSTADLDLSSSIPAFTVALTATDKDTGSKT